MGIPFRNIVELLYLTLLLKQKNKYFMKSNMSKYNMIKYMYIDAANEICIKRALLVCCTFYKTLPKT